MVIFPSEEFSKRENYSKPDKYNSFFPTITLAIQILLLFFECECISDSTIAYFGHTFWIRYSPLPPVEGAFTSSCRFVLEFSLLLSDLVTTEHWWGYWNVLFHVSEIVFVNCKLVSDLLWIGEVAMKLREIKCRPGPLPWIGALRVISILDGSEAIFAGGGLTREIIKGLLQVNRVLIELDGHFCLSSSGLLRPNDCFFLRAAHWENNNSNH